MEGTTRYAGVDAMRRVPCRVCIADGKLAWGASVCWSDLARDADGGGSRGDRGVDGDVGMGGEGVMVRIGWIVEW